MNAPRSSSARTRAYDLVLFDLDGTLIESAPEIADAVNGWLAELGLPQQALETVIGWIGQGSRELMIRAYARASGTPEQALRADRPRADALMEAFSKHYAAHSGRNSRPYDGVVEGLRRLRDAGLKLAVITNKYGEYTAPALRAHGLDDLFDLVLSGDSLPQRKPDPEPVLHALRHLRVAPERALFVGDSDTDVATARNAGVAVWAVPYGYNRERPVAEARPDRLLRDFPELVEALL